MVARLRYNIKWLRLVARNGLLYQWDDPGFPRIVPAHHGVALACPRLSVGKDAHVVAIKRVFQHLNADVLVDFRLRGKVGVLSLQQQGQEQRHFVNQLVSLLLIHKCTDIHQGNCDTALAHHPKITVGLSLNGAQNANVN